MRRRTPRSRISRIVQRLHQDLRTKIPQTNIKPLATGFGPLRVPTFTPFTPMPRIKRVQAIICPKGTFASFSISCRTDSDKHASNAGVAIVGGAEGGEGNPPFGVSSIGLGHPAVNPKAGATAVCGGGTGGGMAAPRNSLNVFHSAEPEAHASVPSVITPAFSISSTCSFEKAPS